MSDASSNASATNLRWNEECFVCGRDNPEGLCLCFVVDEEARTIETEWVPRGVHQGYAGIVHGGLVATILDEAVGKLSVSLGMPGVTAEMAVRFLKPVPPGRPLRVRGRITEVRRRILVGQSEAILTDGNVAASATVKLVRGKS